MFTPSPTLVSLLDALHKYVCVSLSITQIVIVILNMAYVLYLLDVTKSVARENWQEKRKLSQVHFLVGNSSAFCVVLLKVYQNETYTKYTSTFFFWFISHKLCSCYISEQMLCAICKCRKLQGSAKVYGQKFCWGTVGGWSRSKLQFPLRNVNLEESNMSADSRRWNYSTWGSIN